MTRPAKAPKHDEHAALRQTRPVRFPWSAKRAARRAVRLEDRQDMEERIFGADLGDFADFTGRGPMLE